MPALSAGMAAVDADILPGDVARTFGQREGNRVRKKEKAAPQKKARPLGRGSVNRIRKIMELIRARDRQFASSPVVSTKAV